MSEVPREADTEGGSVGGGIPSALLVSAIAVLVVVVSMPRFRAHVLEANREDAQVTIGLLGAAVFHSSLPSGSPLAMSAAEGQLSAEATSDQAGLFEFVRAIKRLRHRFPDARSTGTQGELLHHGYRFATGYVLHGLDRHHALVAWPDAYGKSGDIAFATISDGSIFGHPNRGLWSGADTVLAEGSSALSPGATQGLMDVDLSDESWVLVKAPRRSGPTGRSQ